MFPFPEMLNTAADRFIFIGDDACDVGISGEMTQHDDSLGHMSEGGCKVLPVQFCEEQNGLGIRGVDIGDTGGKISIGNGQELHIPPGTFKEFLSL